MDTQCSEGLRRSLAETDIAQTFGFRNLKDVIYGVRNVMPCKVVDAKKGGLDWDG